MQTEKIERRPLATFRLSECGSQKPITQFPGQNPLSAPQITAFEFGALPSRLIHLAVPGNPNHQVDDHGDVEEQHDDSWRADPARKLIDFERKERRGCDNREILGPALAQQEASAFGEQERRVEEGANAELSQLPIVKGQECFQQAAEVVVVGIDAEDIRPAFHLESQVLVQ